MALAALKNRKMIPANDGTLIPWVSDGGKAMRIAAAQPDIPWTDLAYSLQPNGHTLDYVADAPYLQRGPDRRDEAVVRRRASTRRARRPATTRRPAPTPTRTCVTWYASINAGEPYDTEPARRRTSSTRSPRTTRPTTSTTRSRPAPMLISNGWTDDLFPPDEAIRFYNRTRADAPGHADLADLQRPRPPARPEQGPRRRRSAAASCTPGSTTT